MTGGGRSALWPPGKGEYWAAVTGGYSRERWPGRAPGCASGGRSRLRHLCSGVVARPRPARLPVAAVRAGDRAARYRCGPPRAETGGHPRTETPFDPAVPRSGDAPAQAAAVRAEPPGCRRRCSQQHRAPSPSLKHWRGLKPPEPVAVVAEAEASGRRPSEQLPGSAAAAVTTRPPPPGPLARGRRADDDRAWTGPARRAGRRP